MSSGKVCIHACMQTGRLACVHAGRHVCRHAYRLQCMQRYMYTSVVFTAYDFEFGRPGLNSELGPIYYKASITAQGLPEPSSLRGCIYIG